MSPASTSVPSSMMEMIVVEPSTSQESVMFCWLSMKPESAMLIRNGPR
ncbi:hypothetical protein Mal4_55820 [Maioricimonas rarisocia]|uniref:Uncharacterized protein n=1 Tax=Maioricimonas rarisocia TaxID=2528026 RepID=A0A517ZFF3_9PLAN|nr:hypothetical protein Mal4_55820 [Maioricimonas rarisocia]